MTHVILARRWEWGAKQRGDPHLRNSGAVIGYRIEATDGDIGHVEDFLVEDSSWAIRYMIVGEKTRGVRTQAADAMPLGGGEDRAGPGPRRELPASRRRRLAQHEGARQRGSPSRARRYPPSTDNREA